MKTTPALAWAFLFLLMTAGSVQAGSDPALDFDRAALPDTVSDFPGFQSRIFHEGRVFIAGQPDEDALRALPSRGVTVVVNLRTPEEMENRERIPFDEAAVLDELDIEYVWIPLGGDEHPYTPEAITIFIDALERHEGPVLLHCTVAWRASHLWAAYLVEEHGFPVSEAYARGEAMGIGRSPFAKFLDRELVMIEAE
jgi:uncharacterized protein (TIGR01244 family)